MSDKQYEALLNLYHEYNEAFNGLPTLIKNKFYEKLYSIGC
ncbi:MAG: hypothetical protein Dbin4_02921 [Alphaproteobacteria bacterium]|nr:hypothetical protein [Alphaproteobacteria bacterium]